MVNVEDFSMTNGQIRSFIAVVNEQSFAKAANTLYISQPAISKSISKLEDELGFPVLERIGGILQPTRAGKLLYDFFTKTENDYQELVNKIQLQIKDPMGVVRLGCPETWNPAIFYDRIFSHFHEHFPTLKLEIECCRLPDLIMRLQAGKLDIIMTHEFYPPVQYGLLVRHLTDSGCGILYSNAYFSDIRSLTDLNGADFLVFDSDIDKKVGGVIKRVCSEYGFIPTIRNCGQFSSALFNMSCGKGVMFFTDWDNAINNTSYSYLPLDYQSPVNLIYPSSVTNPGVHLFADALVALYSETPAAAD